MLGENQEGVGVRMWAVLLVVLVGPAWAQVGPLEGRWKFTAAGTGGKEDPPETLGVLELVVQGAGYKVLEDGKETETGTLALGREGAVDTIDWNIASGDEKGKTQRGIFKVEGDGVTLAYLSAGQPGRPQEFGNKQGQSFAVLKRAPAR